MSLLCLGVSHRTAPLAVRERLAFARAELPQAVAELATWPGVDEAVLFSTCNRTELYAVGGVAPDRLAASLVRFLERSRRVRRAEFARALYRHADLEAVRHFMEVAAGLDSQVVGEAQVLGQAKDAHAAAMACGASGPVLNGVCNRVLAAAKRVRTETEIGRLPVSVSSVAVELAERIFGDLAGRTVLLAGTGETAELVAESLLDAGAPRLLVASERHPERARALASRYGGEAVPLAAARDRLPEADVAVVATASPGPVILAAQVADSLSRRRGRPQFFIDLSVPRNIDPAVAGLANAYLYNLDDLKAAADANASRRSAWLDPARRVVDEAMAKAAEWLGSLEAVPTIVALQGFGEACRRDTMQRAGGAFKDLPEPVRERVEYVTKALVAKLLHRPITALKTRGGPLASAAQVRRLFGLEK